MAAPERDTPLALRLSAWLGVALEDEVKERVLKNEADFLQWKDDCICEGSDTANPPERYPCLARTYVSNWNYQEETAEYLYREDVSALLAEFDA